MCSGFYLFNFRTLHFMYLGFISDYSTRAASTLTQDSQKHDKLLKFWAWSFKPIFPWKDIMNNYNEMHFPWTIRPNLAKEGIHFGAFLDMGSGEQIDDLIESEILRLLDWNDLMTDIQLVAVNDKHIHCLILMLLQRTNQSNFHPVVHENFWRDAPYNLTFHPPNMNNERGRKQGIRFRGNGLSKYGFSPKMWQMLHVGI
ncbi:hypothetical protein M9H77_34425 [Catharanthus roseus]|uniref:Uncharacterized protein n=1 Tax=Catharanthus roseus TaxID=4058 RepID=A0ACB9ZLW8_CATRO|nr:hypothetical protein M9H77_34425 [Catharanthus roseus]